MKRHAFAPDVAGMTCREIAYPEYARCGKGPSDPIHDGTRPSPPELDFPYPPCSICGMDTYHDGDGFVCDPCGAHWGGTGPGDWAEPDLQVCASTHKPFDRPGLEARFEGIRHHVSHCIRPEGHDGDHRAGEFDTWAGGDS